MEIGFFAFNASSGISMVEKSKSDWIANYENSIYKNIKWFVTCIFKIQFKKTINLENNSFVINHGDTLSALLGTFIAKKNNCIAVHLEAGGRYYISINLKK